MACSIGLLLRKYIGRSGKTLPRVRQEAIAIWSVGASLLLLVAAVLLPLFGYAMSEIRDGRQAISVAEAELAKPQAQLEALEKRVARIEGYLLSTGYRPTSED